MLRPEATIYIPSEKKGDRYNIITALTIASDIPFYRIRTFVRRVGGVNTFNKMCNESFQRVCKSLGLGVSLIYKGARPQIRTLIREHPKERYVCFLTAAVIAVVEGEVYGVADERDQIRRVWRIKIRYDKEEQDNQD